MKKYIYLFAGIIMMLSFNVIAYPIPKIIYFDSQWKLTTIERKPTYYRTVEKKVGDTYYITDRYLKSQKKQMTGGYTDIFNENTRNGYYTYYDTNENKAFEGAYNYNRISGDWKYYYRKYNYVDNFRMEDTTNFYNIVNYERYSCDSFKIDSSIISDFRPCSYLGITGYFKFSNSSVYNQAQFQYDTFKIPVKFKNDSFTTLNLSKCIFRNELILDSNYISSKLNFDNDSFGKRIIITHLRSSKNTQITFKNALLPEIIDLSRNEKFYNQVDLLSANFKDTAYYDTVKDKCKKPHYLNLYKSDISNLHLDYIHFRLYFPKDMPNEEKNTVYEALLNNFKSRGQMESYEKLDIEYKDFKYKGKGKKWLSKIDAWWWNYGYSKEKVFIHAAFFLIFFTFITFLVLGFLNDEVFGMDDIKYKIPLSMKKFRNVDEQSQITGVKYNLTSNRKLSAIIHEKGLDVNIQSEIIEGNIYKEEYKSITYCLFLAGFTLFMFGFLPLENAILKLDVIANIVRFKDQKFTIPGLAVLTLICLALWIFRERIRVPKSIVYLDKALSRFWLSLVYTSKIFFPVFIKIENLKYRHQLLVFYILFIYLIGLVCLGYMTNIVLQTK